MRRPSQHRSALRHSRASAQRSGVLRRMALGSILWLPCRRGGGLNLLVIGGERRDLLIVELLGEESHRLKTVPAEAALPHLQLKGGVMRILSGEVWDCWQLANAGRAMADSTAGNSFRCITHFGELLTFLDEVRGCARQRRERDFDVFIVSGHVIDTSGDSALAIRDIMAFARTPELKS